MADLMQHLTTTANLSCTERLHGMDCPDPALQMTPDGWCDPCIIRTLLATLARVGALLQKWEATPYQSITSYREGKSDQLDRCEQQLRTALTGDQS